MALFAAGRDATMMVCELLKQSDLPEIAKKSEKSFDSIAKERVKEWRNWFYYEIYSTDPDEEAIQEAKRKMNPTEFLGF